MISFVGSAVWRERFDQELVAVQARLYPGQSPLPLACRYALSGQGKRVRPMLAFSAAAACGGDWQHAIPAALALELVHTYSLVHDDLPCMDDDDLRRGRLTTHKVFDQATALLAGDALLTDAFDLLVETPGLRAEQSIQLVRTLSRAAGGQGMVFGQDLDMHWTARSGYTLSDLDQIHQNKTGALIAAACVMGGICGAATPAQLVSLQTFGAAIGLAFQIADDLLDESVTTGKSSGKDSRAGKLTYLTLMSRDEAMQRSRDLTRSALQLADSFAEQGQTLRALAEQLLERKL